MKKNSISGKKLPNKSTMAPGTSEKFQRIVDSRKTAHGRITHQSKTEATNCEQGEGASIGASSDPSLTKSLSVVAELIVMNQPSLANWEGTKS